MSLDKKKLAPLLLKYNKNGELIETINVKDLYAPRIFGKDKNNLYIGGYIFTDDDGFFVRLISYNYKTKKQKTLINDVKIKYSDYIKNVLINKNNIYIIIETDNLNVKFNFDDRIEYYLIKLNLNNLEKEILPFPKDDTHQNYHGSRVILEKKDDKITIKTTINKTYNTKDNYCNRNAYTYIYEYEKNKIKFVKKINDISLSGKIDNKIYYGTIRPEQESIIGSKLSNCWNSNIAIFKENNYNYEVLFTLDMPDQQYIKDFVKFGDNYVFLGNTITNLSWKFNEKDYDLVNIDWIKLMEIKSKKYKVNDSFYLFLDKNFKYVDSNVYPNRIQSLISSIVKTGEKQFLSFGTTANQAEIKLNQLEN